MSEYVIVETQATSIELLIKALEAKMPKWKGKILTGENLDVYGHLGKNRCKLDPNDPNWSPQAVVVISGKGRPGHPNVAGGDSNDIAFSRAEDGTLRYAASVYDRGRGFNDKWLNDVLDEYAKEHVDQSITTVSGVSLMGGWKTIGKKKVNRFKIKRKSLSLLKA